MNKPKKHVANEYHQLLMVDVYPYMHLFEKAGTNPALIRIWECI